MESLLSALGFSGIAAIGVATLVALYVLNMAFSIFKSFASFAWTCAKAALFVGAIALIWPLKNLFSFIKGDSVDKDPPKFDEFLDTKSPSSERFKAQAPSPPVDTKPIRVFDGQKLPPSSLKSAHRV